ncbi:hypothetical protein [Muricoccus roseus]|uniref:hypothetical protein n=1 Tax=Muricoccus roseus TaxID=198092 RepID=UPI001588200B|nr:hypothetical protein [Roseomonas rosea]
MRLRVFRAARMADAMAECRQALGPDALILSTRRTAAGVEVTAALEPAEEPLPPPPGPAPGPGPAPAGPPDPLGRHNIPAALRARFGTGGAAALAAALRFGGVPEAVRQPLALVGPPGAGKTLTCAKLATRLVLGGAAPLVVTADSQRAGATEQIAAFTASSASPWPRRARARSSPPPSPAAWPASPCCSTPPAATPSTLARRSSSWPCSA